ncbi:MAG: hypothetical protein OEY20_13785, partial [Gemmatimonadota bacterium]|nr:hypothetical protein [Gemmatimonadota bacterium]
MRLGVLRIVVVLVLSVGTLITGFAGAALGTRAGRAVIVSTAVTAANRALRGTVTVGETDGSLLDGLIARDVTLVGDDDRPLLAIGRLQVRYRLADFLSGRIVLGEIELDSVRVTLEQRPGERFNFEQVLRLGEGSGGGRAPLVAFRNARIRDLGVQIRTPHSRDSAAFVERTLEVARGELPYARISSPLESERGIRLEFATLDAAISEPALTVRDANGSVDILGDTIAVDFRSVRTAGITTTMRGRYLTVRGGLKVDLELTARQFTSDDLTDLFGWLPPGVTGSGEVSVRSDPADVLVVRARNLDLRTANGGSARGAVGMDIGPGDEWTARGVDLRTVDFDLAYLEGILDTIPFDGRVSGRTRADGPRQRVAIQLDWVFHDRRADSAETSLRGAGGIGFGVPGDIVFRNLRLDSARVALATVRTISPTVALHGDLEGRGTLEGPWQNATFTGDFAHRRDGFANSYASGWIRLDVRRDTVGAFGSLRLDSLQWDALRPDYPTIPFLGAMAGTISLAGYFDALDLQGAMSGPRGTFTGGGTFVAVQSHLGVRDLDARFERLEVLALAERLPGTAINGRMRGRYEIDTLQPPVVDLQVDLDRSVVGGTRIDSAAAAVRIESGMLVMDSLHVALLGAALTGGGGLALTGAGSDSLVLAMHAEAVAVLQPLLERIGGDAVAAEDTIGGAADGLVRVSGSMETPTVSWVLGSDELRVNGTVLRGVRSQGRWTPGSTGPLEAEGEIQRIQRGERSFTGVRGTVDGTQDSLGWFAAGNLGPAADAWAGGTVMQGTVLDIRFDSLQVRTAADVWRITPGAGVSVARAAVRFRDMRFATADGAGAVALAGALPGAERDSLAVTIEGLP